MPSGPAMRECFSRVYGFHRQECTVKLEGGLASLPGAGRMRSCRAQVLFKIVFLSVSLVYLVREPLQRAPPR